VKKRHFSAVSDVVYQAAEERGLKAAFLAMFCTFDF
jgi:hypothetical protein